MRPDFYVIKLTPSRVIATEVDTAAAAVAMYRGETVLLARPTDLLRVAVLRSRRLTVSGRARPATAARFRRDVRAPRPTAPEAFAASAR